MTEDWERLILNLWGINPSCLRNQSLVTKKSLLTDWWISPQWLSNFSIKISLQLLRNWSWATAESVHTYLRIIFIKYQSSVIEESVLSDFGISQWWRILMKNVSLGYHFSVTKKSILSNWAISSLWLGNQFSETDVFSTKNQYWWVSLGYHSLVTEQSILSFRGISL